MATRGIAILLTENMVIESLEFNGDMYPHGHGDEFFEKLSKVSSKQEFLDFLVNFNDKHFQYADDEMMCEYPNEELYSNRGQFLKHIDLTKKVTFNSDWIFFKNETGKTISIEAFDRDKSKLTQMSDKETLRFNGSHFPENNIKYRIG